MSPCGSTRVKCTFVIRENWFEGSVFFSARPGKAVCRVNRELLVIALGNNLVAADARTDCAPFPCWIVSNDRKKMYD